MQFTSLLSGTETAFPRELDPAADTFIRDLNLDQIVEAVAGERDERDLIAGLLYQQASEAQTVEYRHEVFRDLEDTALFEAAGHFSQRMRQVRVRVSQLSKMSCRQQREGWFLDAGAIYCDAVRALASDLTAHPITSRGLVSFRDYLTDYVASPEFAELAADTASRKADLSQIMYQVRIRGPRVDVSRYEGEPDYSAEIEKTFERFQQGAAKDYRVQYRTWPGMTHVGAQIAQLVARLFPDEFSALTSYCTRHAEFSDPVITQFDRELQFYLAYLDYLRPLRAAGLSFCYPQLSEASKEIFARDTFDLALAAKLASPVAPFPAAPRACCDTTGSSPTSSGRRTSPSSQGNWKTISSGSRRPSSRRRRRAS
jgi:DNA mismatch repair protein MutS